MMRAMARTVRVLYFAAIAEAAGRREESFELPENLGTIDELARWLARARPELDGRLGSVRFAVNEAFVDAGASLADGDVVAVIPPVSGG